MAGPSRRRPGGHRTSAPHDVGMSLDCRYVLDSASALRDVDGRPDNRQVDHLDGPHDHLGGRLVDHLGGQSATDFRGRWIETGLSGRVSKIHLPRPAMRSIERYALPVLEEPA